LYQLTVETTDDWWEVEALYDLVFAPGREALSSYRLREGVDPIAGLGRLARDDAGVLAGAIRVWPVMVGHSSPALLMGPIAVHPTRQGEGLGGALIREALSAAADAGWSRAMLVGDAPYYGRFGFARIECVVMPPPTNPERVLGYALCEHAWDGVVGKVGRFDQP
jgi:predicted N-acetyltransferase YhbS